MFTGGTIGAFDPWPHAARGQEARRVTCFILLQFDASSAYWLRL